ncbi:Uncharacterised protein [Vibrio cholerae]|nr:Uncharacterised protein [Vibrio cholerae]
MAKRSLKVSLGAAMAEKLQNNRANHLFMLTLLQAI